MRMASFGLLASFSLVLPLNETPSVAVVSRPDRVETASSSVVPRLAISSEDDRSETTLQVCALCPVSVLICFLQLGESAHVASQGGGGAHSNPHEFCLADPPTGQPCSGHPLCFTFAEQAKVERLEYLVAQAAEGSMVAARELIAGYGKWVEAVPERQSLLVEACGRVIGFFPVDELTLAEATNPADKSRRLAQR